MPYTHFLTIYLFLILSLLFRIHCISFSCSLVSRFSLLLLLLSLCFFMSLSSVFFPSSMQLSSHFSFFFVCYLVIWSILPFAFCFYNFLYSSYSPLFYALSLSLCLPLPLCPTYTSFPSLCQTFPNECVSVSFFFFLIIRLFLFASFFSLFLSYFFLLILNYFPPWVIFSFLLGS